MVFAFNHYLHSINSRNKTKPNKDMTVLFSYLFCRPHFPFRKNRLTVRDKFIKL